ncbi:MAG: TonB-dependent receptor [Gammaproteobacteria bacterium]
MKQVKPAACLSLVIKSIVATMSLPAASLMAQDAHDTQQPEQIIVTTPFAQTAAETALPVGSLSGEELREKMANTLGDTLRNEIGISTSSFGPGVGHPVIRGQSGNRVSVLSNGVGVTDASNQSPDHAEGVEVALADRLEVIRGPATLLYGSGAVGGVINVIDQRVPNKLVDSPEFFLEQSHNSASNENKTVIRLDAATGALAIHLDAFHRENDNVDIPGLALDEAALEAAEELLHAGEEEHEGEPAEDHEEHEEFENTRGFIGNSNGEAQGASVGLSWIGDRGFIGFSVNGLENNYGLPLGTHSHAGAHGDEADHAEDHEEEGHAHEDVEFVRIDMDKTRYDAKGQLNFQSGPFDTLDTSIGLTNYEHREVEYFADGGQEIGTRFSNDGIESRFTLSHEHSETRSGVWGLQITDTQFAAIGEEAFIPESGVNTFGLFGVERVVRGRLTGEFGLRHEWTDIESGSLCAKSEQALSLSASALYDVSESGNLHIGLSSSQRTPTVEELYSNVDASTCVTYADPEALTLHAATNLLEIGNSALKKETANNIEMGYRHHVGPLTGQFSAYHNNIDDYIYLNLTGEEFEGQHLARYMARDATFSGVEGEVSFALLEQDTATLEMTIFGDLVRAKFAAGGNVPRIPPAKFGAELRYFGDNWSMHLHATRASAQDNVGANELTTPSYTRVSLYGDFHFDVAGSSELKVYLRGDNLLDEEVRNHTSFLKNFAPEPGRAITLGLRFDY